MQVAFAKGIKIQTEPGLGGGGGILPEHLGGIVRPSPKTLTLFKAKICDFPTLLWPDRNSTPYLDLTCYNKFPSSG